MSAAAQTHSSLEGVSSKSTISDVLIAPRSDETSGGFIFRQFLHKDARLSKLATREDKFHLHKTLGMLSVCSFLYRYAYVYNTKGSLGFDGAQSSNFHWALDWATMAVHLLLAFSSNFFRVPKKRIANKPMVIYEEYRQHAQVFTFRCFLVFSIAYLVPRAPAWVTTVGTMACHLFADRITAIHGTPGNTAVRANLDSKKISTFYRNVAKLYALYQFLAIASHILPNARMADLGYNAIIAIQSSAFMMTLYRKRIVRGRTHMLVYSACLLVSAFHIVRLLGATISLLVVATFLVRINLPREYSNKYLVWACFLVAANAKYWQEAVYNAKPEVFQPTVLAEMMQTHPVAQGTVLAAILYSAFMGENLLMGPRKKTTKNHLNNSSNHNITDNDNDNDSSNKANEASLTNTKNMENSINHKQDENNNSSGQYIDYQSDEDDYSD